MTKKKNSTSKTAAFATFGAQESQARQLHRESKSARALFQALEARLNIARKLSKRARKRWRAAKRALKGAGFPNEPAAAERTTEISVKGAAPIAGTMARTEVAAARAPRRQATTRPSTKVRRYAPLRPIPANRRPDRKAPRAAPPSLEGPIEQLPSVPNPATKNATKPK